MLDAKYPSATAVRKYIHAYAQHFGLLHLIRWGSVTMLVTPKNLLVHYIDDVHHVLDEYTTVKPKFVTQKAARPSFQAALAGDLIGVLLPGWSGLAACCSVWPVGAVMAGV
jgi:hypothetical protein